MKTNDLQDLAARVTAPMRTTTAGEAFLEIVSPTLDLLAGGKPASPEEIAAAAGKSPEEVRAALDRFPSAEWDEQGRVVGLGLTLRLTPHRLESEGRTLFAWCALDALLFPVLLGRPASIESPCRGAGEPVHIEVRPAGIEAAEPPSAVVSIVASRDLASVRSGGCNNTHFFSSPEAASRWLERHPEATILPVEDAFRLGRLIAEGLLDISRPDRSEEYQARTNRRRKRTLTKGGVADELRRDPDTRGTRRAYPGGLGAIAAVEDRSRVMTVEKGRDLRPVHRRHHGWPGDSRDLWSHVGVDVESMSPKVRAVSGVVTGGAILLAAALLVLFTDFWWLILIFCWIVFAALGSFARGIAGLMESRQEEQLPENNKERDLLEALRDRGELTPAQAAVETSLTVKEADEMLKALAEGGHLEVRVRGGALSYSLWGHEKDEERGGIGRLRADRTL